MTPTTYSTTLALSSNANPSSPGQPIDLTATFKAFDPFFNPSIPPAGATIRFYDDFTLLGTVSSDSAGLALLPAVTLSTGTHNLRVTFSGGSPNPYDYYQSSEGTLTQVVSNPNTAPKISDVTDRSLPPNGSTGEIEFTVSDLETPASGLIVTAESSNPAIVPASDIVLDGSGSTRKVTVKTGSASSGSSTITLTVTDAGGLKATDTFQISVTATTVTPTPSTIDDSVTRAISSLSPSPAIPAVSTTPPAVVPQQRIVTGADAGSAPWVRLFTEDGSLKKEILAFDAGFLGGVRVGTGDVTGDGIPDVFAGAGPGGGPILRAFNGDTGALLWEKVVFAPTFRGGIFVTVGDVSGDGVPEVVVTPDQGGGPVVTTLGGKDGADLGSFLGIDDPAFRGGARAALGDVDGDGRLDVLISAGYGGGPRAVVFDGTGVIGVAPGAFPTRLVDDFFAFEPGLRNGAYVGLGDLNGDGYAELVFGGGPGGGPRVLALDGARMMAGAVPDNATVANFFAGDSSLRDGVQVNCGDVNKDGRADILTSAKGSGVKAYDGKDTNKALELSEKITKIVATAAAPVSTTADKAKGGVEGKKPKTKTLAPIPDPSRKDVKDSLDPIGTFTGKFKGTYNGKFTDAYGDSYTIQVEFRLNITEQTNEAGSVKLKANLIPVLLSFSPKPSSPYITKPLGPFVTESELKSYGSDYKGYALTGEAPLTIEGRTTADGGKLRDSTGGGYLKQESEYGKVLLSGFVLDKMGSASPTVKAENLLMYFDYRKVMGESFQKNQDIIRENIGKTISPTLTFNSGPIYFSKES